MEKWPELLNLIKDWKMKYLGYIMRGLNYKILSVILQGKTGQKAALDICGQWIFRNASASQPELTNVL